MDFITGLPKVRSFDTIWVIVDRLTKTAHFISISVHYSPDKLAGIYIKEIVPMHGVIKNIISDRDPCFTSKFWWAVYEALGTSFDSTRHLMVKLERQYKLWKIC